MSLETNEKETAMEVNRTEMNKTEIYLSLEGAPYYGKDESASIDVGVDSDPDCQDCIYIHVMEYNKNGYDVSGLAFMTIDETKQLIHELMKRIDAIESGK